MRAPNAQLVVHFGGSPCYGFCRWNPFRGKQLGESRELLLQVRRVSGVLQTVFPSCRVHECEENVASMSLEELKIANAKQKLTPYALCLSDLAPQRRRRFFWPTYLARARQALCGGGEARSLQQRAPPARGQAQHIYAGRKGLAAG